MTKRHMYSELMEGLNEMKKVLEADEISYEIKNGKLILRKEGTYFSLTPAQIIKLQYILKVVGTPSSMPGYWNK